MCKNSANLSESIQSRMAGRSDGFGHGNSIPGNYWKEVKEGLANHLRFIKNGRGIA